MILCFGDTEAFAELQLDGAAGAGSGKTVPCHQDGTDRRHSAALVEPGRSGCLPRFLAEDLAASFLSLWELPLPSLQQTEAREKQNELLSKG